MSSLQKKLKSLKSILTGMEGVLIAYSGGVDSTFLVKVASNVLRNKVVAVTANSEIYPSNQLAEARENAKAFGVKHVVIKTNELDDENFASNSPQRCYYCKKELFSKLLKLVERYSLKCIVDGSNYDDMRDFRPGTRALSEFGIRSPLKESRFTKEEIRKLSKKLSLSTWDKPQQPCLATRFPYGTRITKQNLSKVEKAEKFLAGFGIDQLRVRVHGNMVRIELPREDMHILLGKDVSRKTVEKFKKLGYTYITLDIQGYRTGSMNEALKRKG